MTDSHHSDPSDVQITDRLSVSSPRSPKAIIGSAWNQHQDLLRNAGSLLATTGITSILGAAYWTFSARIYTQQSVGYAAAEIPAMTLLGTIGMLGLGTLLVGELPKCERRAELASAALIACALGSLLLGVGFVIIAPSFNERFAEMLNTLDQKGIFVLGVALTSASMVFDMATIGVMRGGIQLARNITFSVVKIIALPIFALAVHDELGIGIVFSWTAGIAISLIIVAARITLAERRPLAAPNWPLLRSLGKTAMAHNWLEIAISAPPAVFPVLVTLLVSPSANAAFYVAFTLAGFVYMVPSHLATVLFAMAAAEPDAIAHRVRFAAKLSYTIGLPVVVVLVTGSHWILSIYGPGYARIATIPMSLVALGYIPSVPKALYIAICRANGRTTFVATLLTVFTIVEIGGAVVGGIYDGLVGMSLAILVVLIAQGLAITPPILRVIIPRQRRRPVDPVPNTDHPKLTTRSVAPELSDTGIFLTELEAFNGSAQNDQPATTPHGGDTSSAAPDHDPAEAAGKEPNKEQQDAGIRALIALAQSINTTGGFGRIP